MLLRIILSMAIPFLAMPIYGHGDLHERITQTSKEIKNHPDSAYLYLKRGELFFQHEDYKKSIRDFKTCSKLGLKSNRLELGFAESYLRARKFKRALAHLDQVMAKEPGNVKALRVKGETFMDLGRYGEAGLCYEEVIQYAEKTFTENYMEASVAWEKSKEEGSQQKAVEIIKKGISDLGELPVFLDRLVELYLKYGDHESALSYQAIIIEKSNRKETAYYRRALIYLDMGNKKDAISDLENSKSAIEKLPPRIKNNKAMMDLNSFVSDLLETLY